MSDLADLAGALIEAAGRAGAEASDAIVARETSTMVGVSGGALEEATRSEGVELGLRVLIGPRQATVAASDPRAETIAEMAERAVAIAREAPEDRWAGLAAPEDLAARPWADAAALDLADPSAPPAPERLEELALGAEAAAMAVTGVNMVEQASASTGSDEIFLAASNGISGGYRRSTGAIAVSAIAGSGLGRERDFAAELRRHWADMPPEAEIGRRAGERAVAALSPQRPKAGRFPVLYDERVASSLIGHLLGAINGQAVARGASWLGDAMGEAVLPVGIDLWEDPLIVRGRGSRPFDAEGIGARRLDLVIAGRLRSWVLDLASARQLGMTTTGNAMGAPGSVPRPGTGNIRMTPGGRSRAELIAEMGTGLIVTSMIGASVNPTTGAYSRGASGYWVEGGEIKHPVNEITIAGSLPEMMRSIRPADDADPWKTVSVPSLLVEGLTIGA